MTWNMIGHQWAANILKQHILSQSVRHAYLFTGPDHVGKTRLALAFAQAVNCPSGEPGAPCGVCRSCRLILELQHPDLHLLEKEPDRAVIRIEQVRELQYSLALAPYEAKRRIALLPDFHLATYHAMNAMLKTLEEPSDRVVLLLTAPSQDMLLPTIVSRCEVLPLRPVDTLQIEEHFLSEGYPQERITPAVRMAMGSPGLAYAFLQDESLLQEQYSFTDDLLEWLQTGIWERLEKVESWMNWRSSYAQRQARVGDMLEAWTALWRDILQQQHRSSAALIHVEASEALNKVGNSLDTALVLDQLKSVQGALDQLHSNADPRLVLENLVIRMPEVAVLN